MGFVAGPDKIYIQTHLRARANWRKKEFIVQQQSKHMVARMPISETARCRAPGLKSTIPYVQLIVLRLIVWAPASRVSGGPGRCELQFAA